MSLNHCAKCGYEFPGEVTHCPECHRRMDGESDDQSSEPKSEAETYDGPECPHCGSHRIHHRARGLEGFKEYLTVGGFILLCFALAWIIPALIIVPVAIYYLYIRCCPHCLDCDRRIHRLLPKLKF